MSVQLTLVTLVFGPSVISSLAFTSEILFVPVSERAAFRFGDGGLVGDGEVGVFTGPDRSGFEAEATLAP